MKPSPVRPRADTSHLLVNEQGTIAFLPSLACLVGVQKALLLQQIHFLSESYIGRSLGGRRFVFLTWSKWRSPDRDGGRLSWLSVSTIRAHFYALQDEGLIDDCEFLGDEGQPGWAVNHDRLSALYQQDPTAAAEPDQGANPGGVQFSVTPVKRKHRGARALSSPPCQTSAPPPAESARAVYRSEEKVKRESRAEENPERAAAARTVDRASPTPAPERSAPESAAAAGVATGEPKDQATQLRALVFAAEAAAAEDPRVRMLHDSGLGFDAVDAAQLIAFHNPDPGTLAWLIRKARKRFAKDPSSSARGFVVEGLRRKWGPPAPEASRPPAAIAADRQARETSEKVAEHQRLKASIDADDRGVNEYLRHLPPGRYEALAKKLLPDQPDAIRRVVDAKGLNCRLMQHAVCDWLRGNPYYLRALTSGSPEPAGKVGV